MNSIQSPGAAVSNLFLLGFCGFFPSFFYGPGCDRTVFSCRFWWRGNNTKPRHSSLNAAAVSSNAATAAAGEGGGVIVILVDGVNRI